MRSAIAAIALVLLGGSLAMSEIRQGPDWVLVNEQADWQARDSAGEFVYDGRMWILGGWFTPKVPSPRDVWCSPDGVEWTRTVEVAPWEHSDLSVALTFDGRMWLMGGRRLPGAHNSNSVWSSTDGAEWTLECESAGWCPRVSPSFVVFKDRMWVIGGTESFYDHSEAMIKNDVWSSADGREWTLETADAGWSKRAHAQAIVFRGKIWLMGGGLWHPEHVARNDIWCSEDGVNWTQVTESAPWEPRLWFSAVVYRDRLWVLGGWNKEHDNFGDVWYTEDGETWTQVRSDVIWKARHEHSTVVFNDRIWVMGGHARPLNSEVWTLQIPDDWFEQD